MPLSKTAATNWMEFATMYWRYLDPDQRASYLQLLMDGLQPPSLDLELPEWQKPIFWKHVGETIRRIREERGMSQEGLAVLLHKSASLLSQVESGEKGLPVFDLYLVMHTLRIPPHVIFEFLPGEKH